MLFLMIDGALTSSMATIAFSLNITSITVRPAGATADPTVTSAIKISIFIL